MNTVANQIIRIQQAKDDMRTALAEHGLIVPAVSKLEDFSEYVDAIFVETPIHKSFIDIVSRSSYTVDIIPDPPPTKRSIRDYAFRDCTNLALTSLPSGITSISTYAFQGCTSLQSITFEGTPSGTIATTAFTGCTNLTTINVPWGSGLKAGAPWGATNATINYNYTG